MRRFVICLLKDTDIISKRQACDWMGGDIDYYYDQLAHYRGVRWKMRGMRRVENLLERFIYPVRMWRLNSRWNSKDSQKLLDEIFGPMRHEDSSPDSP